MQRRGEQQEADEEHSAKEWRAARSREGKNTRTTRGKLTTITQRTHATNEKQGGGERRIGCDTIDADTLHRLACLTAVRSNGPLHCFLRVPCLLLLSLWCTKAAGRRQQGSSHGEDEAAIATAAHDVLPLQDLLPCCIVADAQHQVPPPRWSSCGLHRGLH